MEAPEVTLIYGKVYTDGKLTARYSCPECGSIDVEKQKDVWFCMSRSCGYASKREFVCVTVEEQRSIDRREGRL
jgi:ribosomal protein L37AE/L43A